MTWTGRFVSASTSRGERSRILSACQIRSDPDKSRNASAPAQDAAGAARGWSCFGGPASPGEFRRATCLLMQITRKCVPCGEKIRKAVNIPGLRQSDSPFASLSRANIQIGKQAIKSASGVNRIFRPNANYRTVSPVFFRLSRNGNGQTSRQEETC